jgi:hypothetical protein
MVAIFLEISKYILPSIVVLMAAYFSVKTVLKNQLQMQEIKLKQNSKQQTIPMQLHAYERLTVFLERIDLFHLLQKLRTQNMTVSELQTMIVTQIRAEFEHNLSQQIYVSNELWTKIRTTKEEMILTVNRFASQLPPNLPAKELSRVIYEHLNESDSLLSTHQTLEILKSEVKKIF